MVEPQHWSGAAGQAMFRQRDKGLLARGMERRAAVSCPRPVMRRDPLNLKTADNGFGESRQCRRQGGMSSSAGSSDYRPVPLRNPPQPSATYLALIKFLEG